MLVFKVASIIQASDGDPEKHKARIKTGMLDTTIVVIKMGDIDRAVELAKDLVEKEGVQAISLCPGFTHEMVAKVKQVVGGRVAINVARGDVPSVLMTAEILGKEGWFPQQH